MQSNSVSVLEFSMSSLEQHTLTIDQVLDAARGALDRVAPMWGLDSFVAVNPYWGYRQSGFIDSVVSVRSFAGAALLMPLDYYAAQYRSGSITEARISAAIRSLIASKALPPDANVEGLRTEVLRFLSAADDTVISSTAKSQSQLRSVTETFDLLCRTNWNERITEELGKFCALYFDCGQAAWPFPGKKAALYCAWRKFASIDRSLEIQGLANARRFFAALPESYADLLLHFQQRLGLSAHELQSLFSRELLGIIGWTAYVQHLAFEDQKSGTANSLALELLAIKSAYSLYQLQENPDSDLVSHVRSAVRDFCANDSKPSHVDTLLYICQEALEQEFLERTALKLVAAPIPAATERPELQAVFCIDVRSEGFRSSLEAQSERIQTLGFAGFFGLPFRYHRRGATLPSEQYPVLLKSRFTVRESDSLHGSKEHLAEQSRSRVGVLIRMVRQSISSGFSYVEAFGLLYLIKMLRDVFASGRVSGEQSHLSDSKPLEIDLTVAQKIDAAADILKNTGLQRPCARVVLLCGHRSCTANNPFAAGLDCGACGGHGGEANARTAAMLLNDAAVRAGLQQRGIAIPSDTIFIAGVHDTTNDRVFLNHDHDDDLDNLGSVRKWLDRAAVAAGRNRFAALGIVAAKDAVAHAQLAKRGVDWSEVRPEWGLARNAAFIAARRSRSHGAVLENRCFLHEYDFQTDHDSSVLELIMTAPMVVASWINLQYYGSAVSPDVFGSGDKVIHNVVGQLGVVLGNGGDLKLGLPLQSVHSGAALFHEPLRLAVIIEAPTAKIDAIVNRHQLLKDLIFNQWLKIYSLADNTTELQRLVTAGEWLKEGGGFQQS